MQNSFIYKYLPSIRLQYKFIWQRQHVVSALAWHVTLYTTASTQVHNNKTDRHIEVPACFIVWTWGDRHKNTRQSFQEILHQNVGNHDDADTDSNTLYTCLSLCMTQSMAALYIISSSLSQFTLSSIKCCIYFELKGNILTKGSSRIIHSFRGYRDDGFLRCVCVSRRT